MLVLLVLTLFLLRQINSQLLTLLIEVTALHSERPGRIGHVMLLAIELSKNYGSLYLIHAFGEGAVPIRRRTGGSASCGRKRHSHGRLIDYVVCGEQQ